MPYRETRGTPEHNFLKFEMLKCKCDRTFKTVRGLRQHIAYETDKYYRSRKQLKEEES